MPQPNDSHDKDDELVCCCCCASGRYHSAPWVPVRNGCNCSDSSALLRRSWFSFCGFMCHRTPYSCFRRFAVRYRDIEKQNLQLLQRMHSILHAPSDYNNLEPIGYQHGPHSMNIRNRREQLLRISRDNHVSST